LFPFPACVYKLYIQTEAIDLRMPGIDTLKLCKAALALGRGGVGYYPHSDFIHVDVGRVRQWCSTACQPHRGRLTRIRISLRKNFFECGIVSVNIVVKMNESVLSHDDGAIDD
jgi:Bacterial protein of unknown function (DUF882)